MTLSDVYTTGILPAYALLPARMASREATVMLLAIGLQESRFEHRHQIGGPAHSWWQFEKGGGVVGVLRHPSTRGFARHVCDARDVRFDSGDVFAAIEHDDVLAAAFARLLLYADPHRLPSVGDVWGAWAYYLNSWRPGKPHKHTWQDLYNRAVSFAREQ